MSEITAQETTDNATIRVETAIETETAEFPSVEVVNGVDITEEVSDVIDPMVEAVVPVADEVVASVTDEAEPKIEEVVATVAEVSASVTDEVEPEIEQSVAPIVEKSMPTPQSEKAEVAPVSASSEPSESDDDSYNPSFALKIFLACRQGFIILFDIILTGIAIVVERLAMINWSGMIEAVVAVFRRLDALLQERLSSKIRLSLYAFTILLLLGLPISIGAMSLFSGDNVLLADTSNNTVNVSQDNHLFADNGILAPLYTATVQQWASDIARWTSNTDISPDMLAVVMQLESCGNPSVVGGLFGVADSNSAFNDPDLDAQTAVSRLESALALSNHDWAMALAIYADGESVLHNDFTTWTFHGRDMYILGRNLYQQAQQGLATSSDLDSWMQNTGAILCTEAQTTLNG
ncbi:MAG: hypothetical protein Phog2KO_20540 [Phototrophicaceae bacterium]